MSTPITTREELTRIRWFVMSAYKNEKKAEEHPKARMAWNISYRNTMP